MQRRIHLILVGGLLSLSFLWGTQFKINYKRGKVYVNGFPARTGQLLLERDLIVAGPRSFAALGGSDGTILKIAANTKLALKELRETSRERKHRLSILKGKISAHVSKLGKRSRITYETPTVVVAVRGTSFVIDVTGNDTRIYVQNGRIAATYHNPIGGSGGASSVSDGVTVNIESGENGRSGLRNGFD